MKVFNSENVPSMNGSGLAGYIDTTYNKLVSVLGEPTFKSPSGDNKVQVQWVLEFEGKLFSKKVYNLLFFFVTLIYQSLKVEVEIVHRESRLQPTLYFFTQCYLE